MEDYKQFLKRLQWENGVTEISNLNRNFGWIDSYDKVMKMDSNLYFISFLPNDTWYEVVELTWKAPRTSKEYIKWTSYARADFDIRRTIHEKENRIISEEELLELKDRLLEWLKQDELLGSYTAVIHSGNWLHLYRVGQMIGIDAQIYSEASKEIYRRIKALFPDNPELWPDFACSNIARMLRLPGSMNYKEDYGLPPHKVEILEYKEEDSPLVSKLQQIWEEAIAEKESKVMACREELDKNHRNINRMSESWDFLQRLMDEVDIADLVCDYAHWKIAPDGINFISNKDWNHTWAFIVPEDNIVIHMWTPHLRDDCKGYNPFTFIKYHYANGDNKEAFRIAKEMFPELVDKEEKRKFYFNKTWKKCEN